MAQQQNVARSKANNWFANNNNNNMMFTNFAPQQQFLMQ